MVVAAYADPDRSPVAPLPVDHGERCGVLYETLLGRLPDLVDRLDHHRSLWRDEDEQLSASESAIERGDVVIEEHPDVDLALVTMSDTAPEWSGHRFTGRHFDGLHPMALNNATERFAVLLARGRRYKFTYRYETWVQYRSRRPRPRVDLVPLAERLTAAETGRVAWKADPVGELTPELRMPNGAESSIDITDLVALVRHHLAEATPAWDPYGRVMP